MGASSVEINYALLCDDVRREDNGKLLIVGAYGSTVKIPQFPAMVCFSLLISFTASKAGTFHFDLESLLDGDIVNQGNGTILIDTLGRGLSGVGPLPCSISKPGLLEFRVRVEGEDWLSVCSIPVIS